MLKERKEQLSAFMDGETSDVEFVDALTNDRDLKLNWVRYHVVRDAMQGKLHDCALTIDIASNVAAAIALDDLYEQTTVGQQDLPTLPNLWWGKIRDGLGKLGQVGLAACVTLGIITGVQYQQDTSSDTPVLNTMPVGVSVSPVGGVSGTSSNYVTEQTTMDEQQYNKMRLLIQDYELQQRLYVQ